MFYRQLAIKFFQHFIVFHFRVLRERKSMPTFGANYGLALHKRGTASVTYFWKKNIDNGVEHDYKLRNKVNNLLVKILLNINYFLPKSFFFFFANLNQLNQNHIVLTTLPKSLFLLKLAILRD